MVGRRKLVASLFTSFASRIVIAAGWMIVKRNRYSCGGLPAGVCRQVSGGFRLPVAALLLSGPGSVLICQGCGVSGRGGAVVVTVSVTAPKRLRL